MGRHHKYDSDWGGEENWDVVDSQSTVEDKSNDVIVEDEVVIQTVTEEEELDHAGAGELLTQQDEDDEGDVDWKYTPTPAGEVPSYHRALKCWQIQLLRINSRIHIAR